MLRNIINNSLKYSATDSRPIEIFIEQNKESVDIRIKDDDIGIPPEEIPRVFEPFYRVDPSCSKQSGGYGLGLSLCKKIMEVHQGQITIANNKDRGITVTLNFPLSLEKGTEALRH